MQIGTYLPDTVTLFPSTKILGCVRFGARGAVP
jgi:hypothetical protein